MRSREEIKADFERTFPQRKEEQLLYQRQKLLLEAIQNTEVNLEIIMKQLVIKAFDELEEQVKKS